MPCWWRCTTIAMSWRPTSMSVAGAETGTTANFTSEPSSGLAPLGTPKTFALNSTALSLLFVALTV